MTKYFLIVISTLFIFFLLGCRPSASEQELESAPYEILATDLDTPWSIDFLPDGRLIFTERRGRVSSLDGGKTKEVGTLDVSEVSESGLLGIAVDPEFEKNNFIYLYYAYDDNNLQWNRVSRFELKETIQNEKILLDKIPSARFHDGGRIKFGPDKKLYITTGDATEPTSAQDKNSLAGKILRMNKDGSIPDDNPFGNYVYSYGHRNSQGLAWHPETGELYSSEHGQDKNDEINLIRKGKNYGWPTAECDEVSDKYKNPLHCYSEFTLAPSGIAFVGNNLYVGGLRGTQVRKIVFADDHKTIVKEEELFSDLGRIREVLAHDGYLYIATSNRDGRGIPRINDDKIVRVKI